MTHEPRGASRHAQHAAVPLWRDVRFIAVLSQLLVLAAVVLVGAFLIGNLTSAMERRGFLPDLAFLSQAADFEIAEHVIPYEPADTFGMALLVGLINTLMVSAVGIL